MGKAIGPRLDRLRGRIGWRRTLLVNDRGGEMSVRSLDLIDAWAALMLDRTPPTSLSRRVQLFLMGARLRRHDGEVLIALRAACREMWRIDKEDR